MHGIQITFYCFVLLPPLSHRHFFTLSFVLCLYLSHSCQSIPYLSCSFLPFPLSFLLSKMWDLHWRNIANSIAKLTERETSASTRSDQRELRRTNLQPRGISSPNKRTIVTFLSSNLLPSLFRYPDHPVRWRVFFYFFLHQNRVGSFNRGPVPWLLARPLAGFEWRAAIAPHAMLRLSHSFSLVLRAFSPSIIPTRSFSLAPHAMSLLCPRSFARRRTRAVVSLSTE